MYGTELLKEVIKNIVINAFVVNGNDKEVCVPPTFHFVCFVFCVVLTNIDEHGDRMWTCLSTPSLWLIGLFSIWRKPPNDNEDFKARTQTIAFKYTSTSVFNLFYTRLTAERATLYSSWNFLEISVNLSTTFIFFSFHQFFFIVTLFFTTLAT